MDLLQLPEEILIKIIHELDTKSIYHLHQTCSVLRNIICMRGVVKKCQFTMSTLQTVKTFKSRFFLDIASHVQELNLCAVPDLRKSHLLPALKKMKSLITLDITLTQLNLLDFIDLYKACPTITNVSLNFMVSSSGLSRLTAPAIWQFQCIFKKMTNVHFIGTVTNLLYSKAVLLVLKYANLDTLKYTITGSDRMQSIFVPNLDNPKMIKFKRFFLYFLDWTTMDAFYGSFFKLPNLSKLEIDSIETIIIIKQDLEPFCVVASPIFETYFQETFDIDPDKINKTEYTKFTIGNAVMMIWNKEDHNFDKKFFNNLTTTLKKFLPCDCSTYKKSSLPDKYSSFFSKAVLSDNTVERFRELPNTRKRKRVAPPAITLDYDELFKNKEQLELSLVFNENMNIPVTLSPTCNFLSKLTYLSLAGSVKFTSAFFNILFEYCINLVTVNIEAPSISPCVVPISKAIHLSKTLKNFRLADRLINFNLLYRGLAQCRTLENIHLVEESNAEPVELGDGTLLMDTCPNLYSFCIEATVSERYKMKKLQAWTAAKRKHDAAHLQIQIQAKRSKIFYGYDPFISVFNLNPIKLM